MTEPKPFPFCGCPTVTVVEGSTFRWRVAGHRSLDQVMVYFRESAEDIAKKLT